MNDFFISYHQETGNKYAFHVYKRLSEDFKRTVFFDTKNKGLSIEINNKLEQAILDSRIFIAIITEGYGDSRWCMGELRYALDTKRSILICCKKGVKLPLALGDPLRIDFDDEELLVNSIIESIFGKLTVVIPAGGNATGLYPLNEGMPKLLLPLGKTPILFQILNSFDKDVISDVLILTNKHFHS
jgi:hypothetical protein